MGREMGSGDNLDGKDTHSPVVSTTETHWYCFTVTDTVGGSLCTQFRDPNRVGTNLQVGTRTRVSSVPSEHP